MPISISEFRTKINLNKSVTPVNRFEVRFKNSLDQTYNPENLSFFCEIAELPGRNLLTTEERMYGPIRKIAYGSSYVETNMTFLCTNNGMLEKRYFDEWMDNIIHPTSFDTNYYENYTKEIDLSIFTETNELVYFCTFYEAYPTLVSGISLNAAAKDDYAKINVTFSYRYWLRNSDQNTNLDTILDTNFEMRRQYGIGP